METKHAEIIEAIHVRHEEELNKLKLAHSSQLESMSLHTRDREVWYDHYERLKAMSSQKVENMTSHVKRHIEQMTALMPRR